MTGKETNKIKWPEGRIFSTRGKSIEEILLDRKKLEEFIGMLYKDRSVINLSGFRQTERDIFLRETAMCKTCKIEKQLRNFWKDNRISDICHNCSTKQEIYDILIDIIQETNNV